MSDYEFTISLRLRHPTIDPAAISAVLNIQPQHSWRAGEPRCDTAGEALRGSHRDSYWMGKLMSEPQLSSNAVTVEAMMLQTLTQLQRAQSFLEQLHAEGGIAELLVSLYARGDFRLELAPGALALLGRMYLGVVLDVHPHSPLEAPLARSN